MNQGTFSDCFAQWLIEAGKVSEFMDILIKEGCPLTILVSAVNKHRYTVVKESEMPTHGDGCRCENCRVQRAAVATVQTENKRTEEVKTNSDGGRTAHKRFAPPDCSCEDCRVRRAAEKAVLEHGGVEYVPEKKFPSTPYSLVVETLCQRILDLIPAHPEILKVHDIWDLFEVPGFECEDLHPSGAQAGGAFAKAKQLHRQGQTVNPDLITVRNKKGEQDEVSG